MMRDRMSRPRLSLPSQKEPVQHSKPSGIGAPGFAKGTRFALGSQGESRGAKIAISTQKTTIAQPTMPTQLSRRRAKERIARIRAAA